MPGSLLNADIMFPQFTEEQSSDEKITVIQNYLFMLLEELRYSFGNIGEENFTESSLENLANLITEPIYVQLYGENGSKTALGVTGEGIFSRIQNVEKGLSSFTQTVDGFRSEVSSYSGQVSSFQQTVDGFRSEVSGYSGQVSSFQQTVNGFRSEVSGIDSKISTKVTQSLSGIQLSVTNGATSSTIQLVSNGVNIGSSGTIKFTGDIVFKSDLSKFGYTTINGGNITTGTISAIDISSCDITGGTITGSEFRNVYYTDSTRSSGRIQMYYNPYNSPYAEYWHLAGGMHLDDNGAGTSDEAKYRMYIYTKSNAGRDFAMKLESAASMSLESKSGSVFIKASGGGVDITGTNIYLRGNVWVNGKAIS